MHRYACFIAIAALSIYGQTATSPHFEAASVKPVSGNASLSGSLDDGHASYTASLADLISDAYGLERGRVSGPDALSTERYTVSATFPPHTSKDAYNEMLQNLLAERFGLVFHRITKEVPGYELIVVPGGPSAKMTASTAPTLTAPGAPTVAGPPERPKVDPEGFPVLNPDQITGSVFADGKQRSTFRHRTMHAFANDLQRDLTQLSTDGALIPVADKTGLNGFFDFHLELPAGPRRLPLALRMRMGQAPIDGDDAPPVGPKEVSAALEKQLGLKLNPVKTSLDYIVVDNVNKVPSEN